MSEPNGKLDIRDEGDIVDARKTARQMAQSLGFGITDVTRIITAISELARNIFQYAGSGIMRWCILQSGERSGIEVTFEDHGPGIADIQQAWERGYSTSGGLGMGLPGAKRLMDEMEIQSEPGRGTTVTVRKWVRRR